MLIGYARVSNQGQNLDLQREALINAGCQKIFEDRISGSREERPGLAKTSKCCAKEIPSWSGNLTDWAGA
jgi:DNA invertase Pin-like site-specific DNA recombinase